MIASLCKGKKRESWSAPEEVASDMRPEDAQVGGTDEVVGEVDRLDPVESPDRARRVKDQRHFHAAVTH